MSDSAHAAPRIGTEPKEPWTRFHTVLFGGFFGIFLPIYSVVFAVLAARAISG